MEKSKTVTAYELTKQQRRYLPIKRAVDLILSTGAIVVLSPILIGVAVGIKIDSPGPILFKQKRVGKNKELFDIYKFRTMRIDAPKDTPTHMLADPEQYITKMGKFLRKTSLDELPQLFNIVKGDMYICSSRPALWNQYDLMEERDKYGVHAIAPGLTGWAQINGRDELEIQDKAKLDGEYLRKMGPWMDIKCILGTVGSILSHDGVVEGGTGEMHKKEQKTSVIASPEKIRKQVMIGGAVVSAMMTVALFVLKNMIKHIKSRKDYETISKKKLSIKGIIGVFTFIGAAYTVYINAKRKVMLQDNRVVCKDENVNKKKDESESKKIKNILITGANSYIGVSVENWLNKIPGKYVIDTLDMMGDDWKKYDFSKYDVVYHVAGIAHADVGNVSDEQKQLYYKVNTDLAVEVAEKAKQSGVKQFIFMSSMIVYSGCEEEIITINTEPKPLNFYGDSKWQADQKIRELSEDNFKVVVIRPPMIYGKGSKGNYPELAKLAEKLPIFPIVKNKRSMLYIDNLCQFVKLMIDNEEVGIFFPQNEEYTNTSDMVQIIAEVKGHRIIMLPFSNIPIKLIKKVPGKIGQLATKAFGNSMYDRSMSAYKENYCICTLKESIEKTEV